MFTKCLSNPTIVLLLFDLQNSLVQPFSLSYYLSVSLISPFFIQSVVLITLHKNTWVRLREILVAEILISKSWARGVKYACVVVSLWLLSCSWWFKMTQNVALLSLGLVRSVCRVAAIHWFSVCMICFNICVLLCIYIL